MIGLMNYNVSRNETGKSQLDKIQRAYLTSLSGKNLTKEQLDMIGGMLVTDARMMDQPEMYSGLEKVGVEFEMFKTSVLSETQSLEQSYIK